MNIVGSFFSSFTAAGSLSRSSVQANAGGKTQLVGIISTGIILVVLAALGPLFYALPNVSVPKPLSVGQNVAIHVYVIELLSLEFLHGWSNYSVCSFGLALDTLSEFVTLYDLFP